MNATDTIQLNGEDGGHQCCNSGACMYCHNVISFVGLQTTDNGEAIALGNTLTINCSTDLAVTTLEWLDNDDQQLINTTVLCRCFGDSKHHNRTPQPCVHL